MISNSDPVTGRCSGDDAVHVCGSATPRLSRCKLQAKKCGMWVYDKAKPVLTDCTIEECGTQGVKIFDYAAVRLLRYEVALLSVTLWVAFCRAVSTCGGT